MPEGTHSTKAGISAYKSKRAYGESAAQIAASSPNPIAAIKGFFNKPFSPGWDKWIMDHPLSINPWRWGESFKGDHTAYTLRPTDTADETKAKITRYIHPVSTYTANAGITTYANRMDAKDIGQRFRSSFSAAKPSAGPNWLDRISMGLTGSPVGISEGMSAYNKQVGTQAGKNRLWELTKKDPIGTAGGFFEGATGLNRKWLWGGLGTLGALGLGAYFLRNRQQPQQVQQPQYPVGSWQQNPYNSYSRTYGAQ